MNNHPPDYKFMEIKKIADVLYVRICDNGWQTNSIPVGDLKNLIELRDKINDYIEEHLYDD